MKLLIIIMTFSLMACAVKKAPKKGVPAPQPIEVRAEAEVLAKIDPTTLEVTLSKDADPKAVIRQVIKSWAVATRAWETCQLKLSAREQEKPTAK